jgi:hypothetical protein
MNADGNDLAIVDSGVPLQSMIESGGSVLNSAMAAWVLSVFSALATRLGDNALANEARSQADELRELVRKAWDDKKGWFHRAYAPGGGVIGHDDMWLEVQPWAILCGAANSNQARSLLDSIAQKLDTPLGTRWRWPANPDQDGIWYYINMTLIWAAARLSPAWAWEQWRRMTLASHTTAYPHIWEGTLSGPDSWNPPQIARPGRTWAYPRVFPVVAMQAFPVNNMHSHAQPLLAYLRLLGVEPTPRGTLAVGKGGDFHSRVFGINNSGHGTLQAKGPVSLETIHGAVNGGPGAVSW